MLDRSIRKQITSKGVDYFFDDIEPVFKDADFAIVNLECPATTEQTPLTKKFIFRADPEWLTSVHKSGITHCVVANNHSYDQGRSGLVSTANNLRQANLTPVGYGINQTEACAPVLLEKQGIKVAVFSSVTLNLESWAYLENEPGMCQASIENLEDQIEQFKKLNPTYFVVVSLHWGVEYQVRPTSLQRRQAEALIKSGADAIIGHHPHVIQSYDIIDGKPVYYSIGNLIFDNPNPLTAEGILVNLKIAKHESASSVTPYRIINGKPYLLDSEEKIKLVERLKSFSDHLPAMN